MKYKKAPKRIAKEINTAEIIDDFLLTPPQLVFNNVSKKITLKLSKRSIDFYKKKAEEFHIPFQNMITRVVDNYALKFE